MAEEPEIRLDLLIGLGLLVGSTFYRPITFWANNAWSLTAPQDVLSTAALLFAVSVVVFLILRSLGKSTIPTALSLSAFLLVAFNWSPKSWAPPLLTMAAVGGVSLVAWRHTSKGIMRGVSTIAAAILVVAPLAQLVYAHFDLARPFPLTERRAAGTSASTGAVEDVIVLIVDGYPMLEVSRVWFDHDVDDLRDGLVSRGFEVPLISWSYNTYTALAIPSILEIAQVIDDTPKGVWGNRSQNYAITRGANFVADSLTGAGFHYTHIESGWNGDVCGDADRCLDSPWLDGPQWLLLKPSPISQLLESRRGSAHVDSTLRTTEHLAGLEVFDDGELDYVYAHLMLPHPPFVTDADCQVSDSGHASADPLQVSIREQLTCVDGLILRLASMATENTAFLIAGDHGTATAGQLEKPVADWTDAEIAERLGALLAYKLPIGCPHPVRRTGVDAMRSIISCAVATDLPEHEPIFMVGANNPHIVPDSRLTDIEERLLAQTLGPAN